MADQEAAKSSGKSGTPRGVRGPQGPARPATTPSTRSSAGRPQRQRPQIPASPNDSLLVRYSRRPLTWLHGAPRWLIVIVMALALVAGLILSGPFTVLGGVLLILVALLALLHRPASDRIQALPALGIGIGLLVTSWQRRRQRRRELLRALRDAGRPPQGG